MTKRIITYPPKRVVDKNDSTTPTTTNNCNEPPARLPIRDHLRAEEWHYGSDGSGVLPSSASPSNMRSVSNSSGKTPACIGCAMYGTHAYIDGANPGFIAPLKLSMGEDPQYIEAIARLKANHAKPELNMKVLPDNFSTDHKKLLANMKMILSDGLLAIDKRFDKLIISLNTAVTSRIHCRKRVCQTPIALTV